MMVFDFNNAADRRTVTATVFQLLFAAGFCARLLRSFVCPENAIHDSFVHFVAAGFFFAYLSKE